MEIHIVGFDGDLYDQELAIELLAQLRQVNQFESKDQLLAQLALDIDQARNIASKPSSAGRSV